MLVDLIIIASLALAGVWGYRAGLAQSLLVLLGVAGGALGALFVLALVGVDSRSTGAAVNALVIAAIVGVLLAMWAASLVEDAQRRRRSRQFHQRRRVTPLKLPATLERFVAPLAAACAALAAVWLVGAAIARIGGLREPLRNSQIVSGLNDVVLPPGPLLKADEPASARVQEDGGTEAPRISSAAFKADPDVRAAAHSVVKLSVSGCGTGASGSGWLVRPGIVVTNAHVVARTEARAAQLPGSDDLVPATPIWFDAVHDVAIVRAPGLRHLPVLELADEAKAGTPAAILGYPGGGPYDVQFARLGGTAMIPAGSALINKESGKRGSIPSTTLIGKTRPGNSGGPVVDAAGRVLAMIYGGDVSGLDSLAVPLSAIRTAIRDAGVTSGDTREVSTGSCEDQ
jgi:S1-C subfamily serine protease